MIRSSIPVSLLFFSFAIGALLSSESCDAQETHLSAGDRVRIKSLIEPRDRLTGTLASIAHDSLSLRADGKKRVFALADLEYVRVSTGEKSHLAGTVVGGLTGALAGAFIGSSIERGLDDECFDYCGLGGGYYGFIFGGLVGGVGGYLWLGKEQWADVPIADLRVGIGANSLRLGLGL